MSDQSEFSLTWKMEKGGEGREGRGRGKAGKCVGGWDNWREREKV